MTKINLKINTDIGLLDLGEPVNITHTLTDDEDWVLDLGLADLKEKFFIEKKEKYAPICTYARNPSIEDTK